MAQKQLRDTNNGAYGQINDTEATKANIPLTDTTKRLSQGQPQKVAASEPSHTILRSTSAPAAQDSPAKPPR